MKAAILALYKRLKHLRFLIAIYWPYGHLCKFKLEGEGSITLNKQMWIIVSDGKSQDALPISFVSEELIKRCGDELAKKWYWPAAEAKPVEGPAAGAV